MPDRIIEVDGFTLAIDPMDSLRLGADGSFEADVLAALRRLIRPADCVVDVGANIGYFTLHAGRLVGPAGRVHAFEPEPENYRLLKHNVDAQGFRHVSCHAVALGEASGELPLFLNTWNGGMHRLYESVCNDGPHVTVPVRRLDNLLGDVPINLLKIDVEGLEFAVLQGARKCLERSPTLKLILEFCPPTSIEAGSSPSLLIRHLSSLGFMAHAMSGERIAEDELVRDAEAFERVGRASLVARSRGRSNAEILELMLALHAELGCRRPLLENLLFCRPGQADSTR